jgi:hypothetical protein
LPPTPGTRGSTKAFRKSAVLPPTSLALGSLPRADYLDVYAAAVEPTLSLEDAARRMFLGRTPCWMRFRDAVVRPLGLKTSLPERRVAFCFVSGQRIGIFRVYARTAEELLLGEDDRHLDFRLSLRVPGDGEVTLTTLVRFHNVLGRLYFFIVRPFHGRVVKAMLRRVATAPASAAGA